MSCRYSPIELDCSWACRWGPHSWSKMTGQWEQSEKSGLASTLDLKLVEIVYLWTRKHHLIRLYSLHYTALCMPDLCKSARASGWTPPECFSDIKCWLIHSLAALGGLARCFFTFTIVYDGESHSSPAQFSTTMPPSWLSTAASVGMAVGPPLVRCSL